MPHAPYFAPSPAVLPFPPDALAELIGLVADGTLSRKLAKDVLEQGLRDGDRSRNGAREQSDSECSDRRHRRSEWDVGEQDQGVPTILSCARPSRTHRATRDYAGLITR